MEERLDSLGRKSVYVGYLRQGDRPPDIVPVSSLSQLNRYIPSGTLAKYEKSTLFSDADDE